MAEQSNGVVERGLGVYKCNCGVGHTTESIFGTYLMINYNLYQSVRRMGGKGVVYYAFGPYHPSFTTCTSFDGLHFIS
jgi:hypothetical protein